MIDGSALDTLVVDRASHGRNPAVSKAVRATRRRLMAEGLPDEASAASLIVQMGERAVGHTVIMLILVSVTGLIGAVVHADPGPLLWAAVTCSAYLALAMVLRRGARREKGLPEPLVQLLQIPVGACWAWFAALSCAGACTPWMSAVFQADALLVAMATSALLYANVRLTVLVGFLPAVAVLALKAGDGDMLGMAMLGMTVCGLAFFTFVAARLRASNLEALRLNFEKDALIGELETANAISDSARHRAEEANLAKSRFLASMSHELRTPLNAIMGFSEVMRDEILGPVENPTYAEYVRDIHRSGRHLLSLINEILDLSRVEADRYPLDFQPLRLAEVAEGAIDTLRVKAGQKGIAVTTRFDGTLRPVLADERAMHQTCLNLLSNAIKFTPHNGKVEVSVGRTAGGGQYLTVSDNGPGIPQEEMPLVVSAFGQGSIALKQAEDGTGLGLAIVQALVGKHEGRLLLASKLRQGTRATVVLPASRVVGGEGAPRTNDIGAQKLVADLSAA